ncbi:hypothetical protein NO1_2236, partial [Candidatus Termititenax aidoneus]
MKTLQSYELKDILAQEAHDYFDKNIHPVAEAGFGDNDVDAFRHSYVSGVFAQESG